MAPDLDVDSKIANSMSNSCIANWSDATDKAQIVVQYLATVISGLSMIFDIILFVYFYFKATSKLMQTENH